MVQSEESVQDPERALLVGVDTGEDKDFERSMEELKNLAKACSMLPVGILTQKMTSVNKGLYIGTGKAEEVREFARETDADLILFDNTLSPSQLRNLQKELGRPVMDRTALILDIFSTRARTREARLQVETARLQYLLPRLVGMHDALTRQGGASGSMSSKGAGEKKLELDRRKIERRLTELRRELEEVSKERAIQRKRRQESSLPKVALVGYTNAGKSTLMNSMIDAFGMPGEKKVFEQDMLFATLDTTVRKIETGNNRDFLLSDTVGFIHKLPHGLVKAFRSTLEEVKEADLLLHVADFSDESFKRQMETTRETLEELGAGNLPVIYVFNKADRCMDKLPKVQGPDKIYLSAKDGRGIGELADMIMEKIYAGYVDAEFLIPYTQGGAVSYFMENAFVKEQDYLENGIRLRVSCRRSDQDKYARWLTG